MIRKLLCKVFGHRWGDKTPPKYIQDGIRLWSHESLICSRCGGLKEKSVSHGSDESVTITMSTFNP